MYFGLKVPVGTHLMHNYVLHARMEPQGRLVKAVSGQNCRTANADDYRTI